MTNPPEFQPIRVLEHRVYRGPNLYGRAPMVHVKVNLGSLEAYPTDQLPGFTEALLSWLPGLAEHGCCYGVQGGFVRRLQSGTWLGHVMEHIALELQCMAGGRVTYGKTRGRGEAAGTYNVLYAFDEERTGLVAGWVALRIINALLPESLRGLEGARSLLPAELRSKREAAFEFATDLELVKATARRYALGPTTRGIVDAARRRGIPHLRLDDHSFVQLGYGAFQQRIRASITGRTSHVAVETAGNKDLTKAVLAAAHLPTPKGKVVRSAEDAVTVAAGLGYPVVTKPLNGNHGRGVSLHLSDADAVRVGFAAARAHSASVIVEQQYQGFDYRALVIGGRLVALAKRVPAHVVGDGRSSVAALIDQVNADPRRGQGHERSLTRITMDDAVRALLERAGLTLESVPALGERVWLRDTANLSTGGTAIDCTQAIHPANRRICERAALAIGLDIAGLDIVAPDIERPLLETGGGIVEVNAAPGFRMHLEPSEGQAQPVAEAVVEMLFPKSKKHRLPIAAITGTNGKTTTARMVARIMREAGHCVGLTTTSGIYIDGEQIASGDTTGPRSARTVLRDPQVDFAVLETARGGILREGLAFAECHIGAVLNVQEDHLGLDGVHSLKDLARVKATVIESVSRRGFRVLNADDPSSLRMRRVGRGQLVLFSRRGLCVPSRRTAILEAHIQAGGTAILCEHRPGEDTQIVVWRAGERTPLMGVGAIPATHGGSAGFNIENALAASAIALCGGASLAQIRAGLAGFETSFEQSPGRMNFIPVHDFTVLLDYAHNPAGYALVGELIANLRARYGRVIGVLGAPGDRRDDDIRNAGRAVGRFVDELILKDDVMRGRAQGESAGLLRAGALEAGLQPERIRTVHAEREAVAAALEAAQPGDLVVIFVSRIDAVWRQVTAFAPARVLEPHAAEMPLVAGQGAHHA
jgi:cyanophycin synthetase